MAKRMERRSARILAFLLAFIMLGSVFAYMFSGGKPEERKVLIEVEDFRELVNLTPSGAVYFEYVNLSYAAMLEKNDPLRSMVENAAKNMMDPRIFNRMVVEVPSGIREVFAASYVNRSTPLYFADAAKRKVYFVADETVEVGNLTVKLHGNIALIDDVSPFVIGYAPLVLAAAETIEGKNSSCSGLAKYLSRINGSFAYAYFLSGDAAKRAFKINNSSAADFFFEGFRYNWSSGMYEKVWGVHFIGNFFFGGMNTTKVGIGYYWARNFDDNFGVAVIGDKDITKVLQTTPNVLTIEIKPVE